MRTEPPPPLPLGVRFRAVEDMDDMALQLTGGHVEFLPLRSGAFAGRFCEINAGGMMIRRIIHGPMLMHGTVRPGHASVQFVLNSSELTLGGHAFSSSDLAFIPAGAALQARFSTPQDRVGILIPDDMLERTLEEHDASFPHSASGTILPVRAAQAARVSATLAEMTDFVQHFPLLAATPRIGVSMGDECRRLLAAVLSATTAPRSHLRSNRGVLERVRRADEFLRANIARPVYSDEICAAVGVAPRTLHQSFMSVYGMTPAAYLKRRRLMLVRRTLLAARHGPALVKSIALAHGFWHLGRFAREYTDMFGELPSATLGAP